MVAKVKKEWPDPFDQLVEYPEPDRLIYADTDDAVISAYKWLKEANPRHVGFDLETYNERTDIWQHVASLYPYIGGKIRLAQIGYRYRDLWWTIILDYKKAKKQSHAVLKWLLEAPYADRKIIGHNLAFEFMYMEAIGIRTTADVFDTNLAARVLSNNLLPLSPRRSSKGYGLDLASCVGRDLQYKLPKDEQTSEWGNDILTSSQLQYAAKDALVVIPLAELYHKRLVQTKQIRAATADFRALPYMAACNATGISLDLDKVLEARETLIAKQQALREKACEVLGVDNPNSPAQLLKVFKELDPTVENTTSSTVDLLIRKHPQLEVLKEYKGTLKLLSTYVEPWLHMAELTGGTVHPNLKMIGADTGRMSCPTAFNKSVPSGEYTKTGKAKTKKITLGATLHGAPATTRDFFVARPGYVLIDADFSAIEVRLAAHMYNDAAMRELALDPTIDAHTRMATRIFGVPQEEVSSEQRKVGKTSNFALQYGCGVPKLHAQLESVLKRAVPIADARKAYDAWHDMHQGISRQMNVFRDRQHPKYHLRSPLGRVMCLPDPTGRMMKNEWGHVQPRPGKLIHTNGVNWPIQSAGRDLLAEAAILVWQQLLVPNPEVLPLHMVHDELLLEVPEHMVEYAMSVIRECMTDPTLQARYLGTIPLACDVLKGHRWSEAH